MNMNSNNQDAGVNRHAQSANQSALSNDGDMQSIIIQANPRATAGNNPLYKDKPSFTYAWDSYERAARREYIKLMRNLVDMQQYPGYHVIVNFYNPMPVKIFIEKRSRAHGYLARWKIRGYYVHEPTRFRDWLHIHMMAIYGGGRKDLRECIKIAWELAGLKYGNDFRVKVFPVGATIKDYRRLCAYILKFNGKRKKNRYTPDLFCTGLGLRKIGTIGKWFAKTKGKIWKEYLEELRLMHEQQAGKDIAEMNKPSQSVISKTPVLRSLQESQRAMTAHDVWESSRTNRDVPRMTLNDVAVRFNVSKRMVQYAGRIKVATSETTQEAIREGKIRLGTAADATKKAAKETGVRITKNTSVADKQTAFKAQERFIPGESNEQQFYRNIAEMQKHIAMFERVADLLIECDEMLICESLAQILASKKLEGLRTELEAKLKDISDKATGGDSSFFKQCKALLVEWKSVIEAAEIKFSKADKSNGDELVETT